MQNPFLYSTGFSQYVGFPNIFETDPQPGNVMKSCKTNLKENQKNVNQWIEKMN